jgi:beta-aspartyl-peptidase (threonine type)
MIPAPWSLWRLGGLFLLATTTALVGWFTLSGKDAKPDESTVAKKAVRQVLDDQVKAWNKGDLEGFMKSYWKSRKLTFFSGKDRTQGWQATIERYRKRYQTEGRKMGKLTFSELEIEVLGPTQAWARGRWQVVRDKEKLSGLFTLIFKKMPEGWRIVHDHTSAG